MKKTYNTYKKSGVNMANVDKLANYLSEYQEKIQSISDINMKIIHRESWYNQSNLFYYSIALYIMTFLLIGIGWIANSYWINKLSILSIITGFILHGYGIIVRMIIMNRPPVSTLYESIIFVGFISVLFSQNIYHESIELVNAEIPIKIDVFTDMQGQELLNYTLYYRKSNQIGFFQEQLNYIKVSGTGSPSEVSNFIFEKIQ